jgi:ribulose-phosphate 3-epimerase
MQKVEIIPSILSADFAALKQDIKKVEKAGCRRLHLDVMDGHFVPNITIGPVVIRAIRKCTKLYLQTHLMIEHPQNYIDVFRRAGSDCIIIHQEACGAFKQTIRKIKRLGIDAGIALRPKTPVKTLQDVVTRIDMVLVMSVEPGFGGQEFIRGTERKVAQLKRLLEQKKANIPIGVDGGINSRNAALVYKAGATHLIAGNAVFKGDAEKNIKAIYKSIER